MKLWSGSQLARGAGGGGGADLVPHLGTFLKLIAAALALMAFACVTILLHKPPLLPGKVVGRERCRDYVQRGLLIHLSDNGRRSR